MTRSYRSIVVLTGAGVSAESGIRTFRDEDGLWEGYRVDEVATPEAYAADPDTVYRFYNERRRQLQQPAVQPNAAHQALARFEHEFDGDFLLVTQNIDDLHERAGSKNLIHMHGELLKARCAATGNLFDWRDDFDAHSICRCCGESGHLRPHVVWFGEIPLQMEHIQRALLSCDLFISIGTSGLVYPAAGFGQLAARAGADTVELNLHETGLSPWFGESRRGPASQRVPELLDELRR